MFSRTSSHRHVTPNDHITPGGLKGHKRALLMGLALFGMASLAMAQSTGNLRAWLGVDVIGLIRTSDFVGRVCLVILAFFSISSWMIIVYKFWHLRSAAKQTEEFVELCSQGSGELEEAFRHTANFPDSPLAQILREGYLELEVENWYRDGYDLPPEARLELAKVGMERIFERTISNEITHLESKLVFLATTTHVCPFIGLFGTVWGIMGAFQVVANQQSAVSLSNLAPGIATGLMATIGGLVCAIPASVMYNYLTHQVRLLIGRMDAFALELSNIIQKQIMKQSISPTTTYRSASR